MHLKFFDFVLYTPIYRLTERQMAVFVLRVFMLTV